MASTTDDLNRRFKSAANRAADGIQAGDDPYDAAAYGGPGKVAAPGYAANVAAVIAGDNRIIQIFNQGLDAYHTPIFTQPLLNRGDAFWVHFFTNNLPNPTPYRVYVCTQLAQTHNVLQQLLQGYNAPLKFKVATHPEAQQRNDTIVSWHQSLADARLWANIARANAGLLDGEAPAGTFGGIDTSAVGIDSEVAGDTSTSRIARAAVGVAAKRLRNNPYL